MVHFLPYINTPPPRLIMTYQYVETCELSTHFCDRIPSGRRYRHTDDCLNVDIVYVCAKQLANADELHIGHIDNEAAQNVCLDACERHELDGNAEMDQRYKLII